MYTYSTITQMHCVNCATCVDCVNCVTAPQLLALQVKEQKLLFELTPGADAEKALAEIKKAKASECNTLKH